MVLSKSAPGKKAQKAGEKSKLSKSEAKKKAQLKLAKKMCVYNVMNHIGEFNKNSSPENSIRMKHSARMAICMALNYIIHLYCMMILQMHAHAGKPAAKTRTSMRTITCCTKAIMPGELQNHSIVESLKAYTKLRAAMKKN